MNCADAAEKITALVDGELPLEDRVPLERHLAECAACRDARAAEEAIAARVRALGRPPLPDGFRDAVLDRVRAEPVVGSARPSGRIIPLGPWLAAGAAAAAAALGMVYFGGGDRAGAPVASVAAEKPALAIDADSDVARRKSEGTFARAESGPDKGAEAALSEKAAFEGDGERRPDQVGGGVPPPEAPAPRPMPAPAPAPPAATPAGPPPPSAPKKSVDDARRPEAPAGGAGGAAKDMEGGRSGGKEPAPAEDGKEKRSNSEEAREEEKQDAPSDFDARARAKSEDAAKARKGADEEGGVRRLALFFRAPGGPSAERDIDRVLLAHRELALETVGWKDTASLETASGRAMRTLTAARDREGDGFAQGLAAKAPAGRVIQVRLRARDVDRVREALGKAESVREAGSLLLLDIESRDLGEIEIGALADLANPPAPDEGLKPGAAGPPATAGATPAPTPAPAEPMPPPPPSKEALEKLARGVDPATPSRAAEAKPDPAAEVWLEIHLLGEPSPR